MVAEIRRTNERKDAGGYLHLTDGTILVRMKDMGIDVDNKNIALYDFIQVDKQGRVIREGTARLDLSVLNEQGRRGVRRSHYVAREIFENIYKDSQNASQDRDYHLGINEIN